jgi:hypothetical protein
LLLVKPHHILSSVEVENLLKKTRNKMIIFHFKELLFKENFTVGKLSGFFLIDAGVNVKEIMCLLGAFCVFEICVYFFDERDFVE